MGCRGHWVESDEVLRVKHWHLYMRMRHYLAEPTLRLKTCKFVRLWGIVEQDLISFNEEDPIVTTC